MEPAAKLNRYRHLGLTEKSDPTAYLGKSSCL